MSATITNCYTDAAGTSAIALHVFALASPALSAPSDFFSRDLFNVHAGRTARIAAQIEILKSRFARIFSRSNWTGLFENVEREMTPLWKKGDVVTIYQMSPSKGLLVEGRATVVKALKTSEHYMVRFHRKDGKLEREAYERFIDRDGQEDSAAYVREFNKRIGYTA